MGRFGKVGSGEIEWALQMHFVRLPDVKQMATCRAKGGSVGSKNLAGA